MPSKASLVLRNSVKQGNNNSDRGGTQATGSDSLSLATDFVGQKYPRRVYYWFNHIYVHSFFIFKYSNDISHHKRYLTSQSLSHSFNLQPYLSVRNTTLNQPICTCPRLQLQTATCRRRPSLRPCALHRPETRWTRLATRTW